MEKEEHETQRQALINELIEFGFEQKDILTALTYTNSKQIAAEIIVKLLEEGPNADLSIYKQDQPKAMKNNNIIQEKILQNSKPTRPKMIFVVNGSLKMGKGKICAQVAHGVIGAYLQIEQQAKYDEKSAQRLKAWESSGSPKVVVKSPTEEEMIEIEKKIKASKIGINTHLVQDAGHTQIKAGSRTILAIGPAFSNQIDPFTEHLKLV